MTIARQFTCVSIEGRAILIDGAPGTGKSSLALALIDRGAMLVGDDGVLLEEREGKLFASPHPNTRGLLEVRNIGLVQMDWCDNVQVCLHLSLSETAPRLPEEVDEIAISGVTVPSVLLWPGAPALHLRAELALQRFGLLPG